MGPTNGLVINWTVALDANIRPTAMFSSTISSWRAFAFDRLLLTKDVTLNLTNVGSPLMANDEFSFTHG
jgi:hypothetical protein